jgi:dTDP-4-dehydrorhamnose reductase
MADSAGPVLILGAGGLLGQAFTAACAGRGVATAGRAQLEGRSDAEIAALVRSTAPALVVNCAADVDADGAEQDPSRAIAANTLLPGIVAAACRDAGALMLHFSSTGCYGAWKEEPYTEDDPPRPTTAHHRSKLAGEEAVRESGADHLIARIGWLYGGSIDNPKNFVWRRLLEACGATRLASDATQRGCPTDVADVARQALHAAEHGVRGTINLVARGSATRFDYVTRIVRAAGLACDVVPAPAFARAAPVSPNEAAISKRLQALGLDIMPLWGEAVDAYVSALRASAAWSALEENAA